MVAAPAGKVREPGADLGSGAYVAERPRLAGPGAVAAARALTASGTSTSSSTPATNRIGYLLLRGTISADCVSQWLSCLSTKANVRGSILRSRISFCARIEEEKV